MTCGIAIRLAEGGVLIASDTCASGGSDIANVADKIFKKGKRAITYAGGLAEAQKIAREWFLVGKSWRELADMYPEKGLELEFVYAGPEGLRFVDGHGAICTPRRKFEAVGSGRHIALGWLAATLGDAPTVEHAKRCARGALGCASEMLGDVRPPFKMTVVG